MRKRHSTHYYHGDLVSTAIGYTCVFLVHRNRVFVGVVCVP
jgi:hypothetical protein